MRIFLILSIIFGLVALTAADKKCDSLEKGFKDCLSKGFKPKKLEGCKSGAGKMEKTDVKKCAKIEKKVIKKCDFSCDDEDGGEDGGDVREPFVPAAGSHYLVKKMDAPGAGQVVTAFSADKRNSESYFMATTENSDGPIPWKIEKASCNCQDECSCYKFTFRVKVTCCRYMYFAMSAHSDTLDNGDGRVIVHKTPYKPEDESWVIEPAVNGYKLKKAQGRHEGKYLVARVQRPGSGTRDTMFADITADSSAASIWDFETVAT